MEIWLIDDDNLTNLLNGMVIADFDSLFIVREFDAAEHAINELRNGQCPDIIFLDINMPVMDGWGFLDELDTISSIQTRKPFISVLTSSLAYEDKDRALKSKWVNKFIIKPLSRQLIVQVLEANANEQ
ncbi:MAG: response regulator [Candidatus Paceibacterota bacterium]